MCLVQGRHVCCARAPGSLGPGLMLGYVRVPTKYYSVSVIADAEMGVEARAPLPLDEIRACLFLFFFTLKSRRALGSFITVFLIFPKLSSFPEQPDIVVAHCSLGSSALLPPRASSPPRLPPFGLMVTIHHPASQGPEIEPTGLKGKLPSVTFGLENVRYLAARLSFSAHSQLHTNTCLLVYNDQPSFLGFIISHIVFPSSTGLSNGVAQDMPSRILVRLVSPS
ncbi:hypothetical protein NEUTE2DRAFT_135379 [Neurospora tetrasperma FGSC 2509]|nr:hypothetical protein NEUTE2DRAFT_135379 [Neurospora tetrasperma FGSC 2509]